MKVIRVAALLSLLAFLAAHFVTSALAQAPPTGTISGTVSDASAAVLQGATITVTDAAGMTHTATSSDRGAYEVKGLAAGTYSIKVTLAGFKDFEAASLQLAEGQTLKADASMEVAEITSKVEVQGQGITQVETESAQIAGSVTEKEVTSLTLNGRNFTQLAALAPGISNQTGQDEASVGIKGSVRYSVNGGRVEYNSFDVDGGDVLNALNASTTTLIVFPSPDSIQELQVLTSNYGAMYGRSASGTILAATKTGGSSFHGDGYFFFRNNVFNDRNFFDQTQHAPLYQKYNPGGTIGGPLYIPGVYNAKKDKTYFFFSEEYRHEKSPTDFNQAVPSFAERNCLNDPSTVSNYRQCLDQGGTAGVPGTTTLGDFSDVCPRASSFVQAQFTRVLREAQLNPGLAYAPDCPAPSPSTFDAATGIWIYNTFPGNLVPISPTPTANIVPSNLAVTAPGLILNSGIIPNPTAASGCNSFLLNPSRAAGGSCYNQVASPLTTWREELFRLDHNFNSKTKLSFRYIHDAWTTDALTPPYATVQNSFPTIQNNFVGPGLSLIAHLSNTFSTKFYNDLAMSYTTDHISLTDINGPGAMYQRPGCLDGSGPNCSAQNLAPQIGYLFNNGFGGKVPGIVIGGTNFSYGGQGFAVDPAYMPWHHSNPTYSPRDDATIALNRLTLTFGFLAIIAQRNEINPPVGANTGDLQGIASFSNINSPNTTGNAFADFLQGRVKSFQQDSGQLDYHNNYIIGEPYIQGDWHVSQRLTLNLGVRFSLFGNYHEKYSRSYNWDPAFFSNSLANEVSLSPFDGRVSTMTTVNGMTTLTPVPRDPANIDPHLLNGVVQCGTSGVNISCMKDKIFNPAPRIGFAWDPTGKGKTSIRGGYGIFYEHGVGNEANTGSLEGSPANAPNGVIDMTQFQPGSWLCIGYIASGCNSAPQAYALNVTSIPTKAVWPYVQQWSLSVQQELPGDMLMSIAYVGSKGTHLTATFQANQLAGLPASADPFPAGVSLTVPTCTSFNGVRFLLYGPQGQVGQVNMGDPGFFNLQAACYGSPTETGLTFPDPNYLRSHASGIAQLYPQIQNISGVGQIYALANIANSSYHALQFTLRRTKGPLTLGLSYSYSHSFDNSSDRTDPVVNAFDLNQNRASSNFDERHLLNVDYIYQIPVEKIFNWMLTPIASKGAPSTPGPFGPDSHAKWFKGWAISGITIFASGTPFSIINGGSANGTSYPDNAGVLSGNTVASYPDIVAPSGSTPKQAPATIGPLLGNPYQFAAPTGLTFGDAGRNSFNNPSRLNWDISLIKDFKTSDNTTLELRVESYNFFNHTQFEIFDASRPGTQGNNVITCYGAPFGSTNAPTPGDSSCLTGNSFLHPIEAHQPRTVQFGVKFLF